MKRFTLVAKKNQRGIALVSLMVAIMITTILAAMGASKYAEAINEAAAEATAKYLLTVRGAVISALSDYNADLKLIDTSEAPDDAYPDAPAWVTGFTGSRQTISVNDLKDSGHLEVNLPDTPPLGRSAHINLSRTGTCPGPDCTINAYVYTCFPISKWRSNVVIDASTCPAPPSQIKQDTSLLGQVLISLDGYGGTNSIDSENITGPLFDIPASDLLPHNTAGNAVALASLNSTMFDQFVRQGDERHIYLNDRLTVEDVISTNTGLNTVTAYTPGTTCDEDGVMGTSDSGSLVTCTSGEWFEITSHIVKAMNYFADGETIPSMICPGANTEPFAQVSMQTIDSVMTGADVDVRADLAGTISGSGNADAMGNVSVSGTFSGTAQSSPDSSIRIAQQAILAGQTVTITPPTPNARALVVQGCRYL